MTASPCMIQGSVITISWTTLPSNVIPCESCLQPECLVNGRVGHYDKELLGDYQSMTDNGMPIGGIEEYWETPQTLNEPWGYCTRKGSRLFLHVFDWPENGQLSLNGLNNKIEKAYSLLDPEEALTVDRDEAGPQRRLCARKYRLIFRFSSRTSLLSPIGSGFCRFVQCWATSLLVNELV